MLCCVKDLFPALEKLQVQLGVEGSSLDPPQFDVTFPFAHCPNLLLSPSMDCLLPIFPYHRSLEIGQALDHLQWMAMVLPMLEQGKIPVWSQFHSLACWLLSPSFDTKHIWLRPTTLHCDSRHPDRPSSLLFSSGSKCSEGSLQYLGTAAYFHSPAVNELLLGMVNAL